MTPHDQVHVNGHYADPPANATAQQHADYWRNIAAHAIRDEVRAIAERNAACWQARADWERGQ